MIVQGTADSRVDPHNAVEFSAALDSVRGRANPDSLWLVPGAEHVRSAWTVPVEYERRLSAFFARALGPP
jgi:fermentation-respiration switch protein FrsA (DUF1100 family)